jgi:serine/threonine-protein kinase
MRPGETEPYNRLEEALVEYELAREQGKALDRAEFLSRYADLAAELEPLFAVVPKIERLACPLRDSLGGKPPLAVPTPDGYEIIEQIGLGGMGVVYKAWHLALNRIVALKLLRPDWLATLDEPTRREAIELFRDEARKAARLQHPNRVRILNLGEHEGRPFYSMELIEGGTLADKLKRPGGVSKEKVVKYLAGIAEAVQDAHDHGILHRDIKPGNILIEEETDEAKLTDFGLAMIAPTGAGPAEQSVREQARVAGTLPYMSPEQTQDANRVTVRSDVYSLGATLYEALTGVQPFTGTSRAELLARIRDCEPEPPGRHRPDINPELERICLRCLHKAPEQRFATARELAESLRGFTRDVQYMRNFTASGAYEFFVLGPTALVSPLVVYWMLQGSFWEPVVWLLMFSGYLTLGPALLRSFRFTGGGSGRQWRAVWGGHAVAAASIAVALRTGLAVPPRDVILLMYPVFAALSGMAYLIEASKMPWKMSLGPVGYWLVGVVMLFHREAAPIYYGAYTALGVVFYGLYLRKLGKQLR